MSRAWIALGVLLAILAGTAAGFAYGVHVTRLAWHVADSKREAAQARAETREWIRKSTADSITAGINLDLGVDLARIQAVRPTHVEITRHALQSVPALHRAVLPAALVRLRQQQAAASAAIASRAAQLGHTDPVRRPDARPRPLR